MTTSVESEVLSKRAVSLEGSAAAALREKYPEREVPGTWAASRDTREQVLDRLAGPPHRPAQEAAAWARIRGARRVLEWLEGFPGASWQQRWNASSAGTGPYEMLADIRTWSKKAGLRSVPDKEINIGTTALVCADVVRPSPEWLLARHVRTLRTVMMEVRDPAGFARLEGTVPPDLWSSKSGRGAHGMIAVLLAAKGGYIQDLTFGDMLALRPATWITGRRSLNLAYSWLRNAGVVPFEGPATLRDVEVRAGQVSADRLVDRYQLKCRPVRDLIVDYLTERQPSLDYGSLVGLSRMLASQFWADLERHHPGIDSLDLAPDVAAAWKARLATKTMRTRQPDGTVIEVTSPRSSATYVLMSIRAFYLDLAQWAVDEPGRWGPWAVRCPIKAAEISTKKLERQQKARMDQRTRERLPVLPVLVRTADQRLKEATIRLKAVLAAPAGSRFTALGVTYTKARSSTWADPNRTTTVYPEQGKRLDLRMSENRAFWSWAAIEVLRHTGIRIEELLELSHHSIVQYRLPTTGEIVPLLQIAPSKTDEERMLLVTPDLADVLSAIVSRVRDSSGAIPLVASYDTIEKTWNPPMPLLFQWFSNGENRALSPGLLRKAIGQTLTGAGLTDNTGQPLHIQPHDFRRIFITDAVLNGLPPHIAQVIAGHRSIGTTMGYNTVYPAQVIEAHRAFIARRRNLRPSEEYRVPTSEEWDSFLAHFERRKLSLGICGRAFGTDCIHEHACVRCSMLRVDPEERPRLEEIRDNLVARIAEAEREGWLGEVDGLSVSLAAAEEKLTQLDAEHARASAVVHLGLPSFSRIAARSSEADDPSP
ncbi:site-specific integrase [Streptomyces sp. AC550_RSS872]|uniref:tyrosine-type recombinase/integrase n=1 Tax=Streptomyces sp. AC550_RSS872 TaxID=2823689 RepID=UPI001C27159D|nr:site-specific integrase [Streptomyces sp. AC550_RSS872]